MKRVILSILFLVLLCSCVFLSGAEEKVSVTIVNPVPGHVFTAYQIFSGDVAEIDGKTVLCNYAWGKSIDPGVFGDALWNVMSRAEKRKYKNVHSQDREKQLSDAIAYLSEKVTQGRKELLVTVIKYMVDHDGFLEDEGITSVFEDNHYVLDSLPSGYFVLIDRTGSEQLAQDLMVDRDHFFMISASEDMVMRPKVHTPVLGKEVAIYGSGSIPYTEAQTGIGAYRWTSQEVYGINEPIVYQLTASIPENAEVFDEYTMRIIDEIPEGMTIKEEDEISIRVSSDESGVFDEENSRPLQKTIDEFQIYETEIIQEEGGTKLIITVHVKKDENLFNYYYGIGNKAQSEAIRVRYKAYLNDKAKVGTVPNTNTAHMEYTNDPYRDGWGKTKDAEAHVYTGEIIVKKVDKEAHLLKGATFELSRYSNENAVFETLKTISDTGDEASGRFEFKGIGPGVYCLQETEAPQGYNLITGGIYFQVMRSEGNGIEILNLDVDSSILKKLNISRTYIPQMDSASGICEISVVNESGIQLPSTGGSGVRVLYLVGISMILAALFCLLFSSFQKT